MKIIHIADVHYCRERQEEALTSLRCARDYIKENAVDMITVAGDIFDSATLNAANTGFPELLDTFKELADLAPVAMVYGTPSHDTDGSLEIFRKISCKYGITILEPGQAYFLAPGAGGIFTEAESNRFFDKNNRLAMLFGIPEPRKKYLLVDTSAGKDETEEAIRDAMHKMCFLLAAKRKEYAAIPCIVLYHGDVAGCTLQNDQTVERGTGISVTIDDLNGIDADYYALGHIHKPQRAGKLPAYYAGSIYPKNFGETHKAGFNVVELTEAGSYGFNADVQRVHFPHPQNIKIEIAGEKIGDQFLLPKELKKFKVWLDITCPKEMRALVDAEKQLQHLIENGAVEGSRVTISDIPVETVRAAEITAVAGAAQSALETGAVDHEKLVDAMAAVYEKYRYMASEKAVGVAEKYLDDILAEIGLSHWYEKSAYGTASMGGWYRMPDGKRVFVEESRHLEFLRRYQLDAGTAYMNVREIHDEAAREAEALLFAVIEGGKELGRSKQEIKDDLLALIQYGGDRVVARWAAVVSPYNADGTRNEKKMREGWEREYILTVANEGKPPDSGDWIEYPSYEATRILAEPYAQAWMRQESIGAGGQMLLPPGYNLGLTRNHAMMMSLLMPQKARVNMAMNAYSDDDETYKRKKRAAWLKRAQELLGTKDITYKEIRVIRTESSKTFNEQQREIAREGQVSTGKVTRRLAGRRDAWKCLCKAAAHWINEVDGEGKTPDEINEHIPESDDGHVYEKGAYAAPLHPNCDCIDIPVMKTADEAREEIFEKYFGEKPAPSSFGSLGSPGPGDLSYRTGYEAGVDFDTARPSALPKIVIDYDNEPNYDHDSRAQTANAMNDRGIYADFDESKKENVDYIPKLFDDVNKDFPGLNTAVKIIGYSESLYNDEGAYYSYKTNELIYNKNTFNSTANLQNYISAIPGLFASTERSGVIAHEYGHAVFKHIKEKTGLTDDQIFSKVNTILDKHGIMSKNDRRKIISEYAASDDHELIAEIVSDVKTMKNPRAVSIDIYNMLKSLLGGIL